MVGERRPPDSQRDAYWRTGALGCLAVLGFAACNETFEAGSTTHGLLPVDERNPILLINDSNAENWQGEYAILLSNGGGPKLVDIIVGTSPNAHDVEANTTAWRAMVAAAKAAKLDVPDPIGSTGAELVRPASGVIDETTGNVSEGALLIKNESERVSLPYRPLVVVTGGRLTDVADAYLLDHTVPDRVVVVSSLGTVSTSGGAMGNPNGEMDPWADTIVASRFRYVQVSAYYDQLTDVPASHVSELPDNEFGAWIANKQSGIWNLPQAADQVGVAAVGIPNFATAVERVSILRPTADGATTGPDLTPNAKSSIWLVTQSDSNAAIKRFWDLLRDPATFGH